MVAQLRNGQSGEDRLQKSKTAHDRLRNSKTVPKPSGLRYPSRLSENERVPADRYLERLLADRRQQVLDELEGRIRAEKKGAAPVISEVQFLIHLCRCVEKGTFLKAFSVERGRPLMRS